MSSSDLPNLQGDLFPGENNDIEEGSIDSMLPENGVSIPVDAMDSDGEVDEIKGIVKTLIDDLGEQVQQEEKNSEEPEEENKQEKEQNDENSEHHCELCDVSYADWEDLVKHYDDSKHGEKYLTTQITIGFKEFDKKYQGVPFRMKDPKNIANKEKSLDRLDVHLLRCLLVKENHCLLCAEDVDGGGELEPWKSHITGDLHSENYNWTMASLKTTEAYREKFGCLPMPDVFKTAENESSDEEAEAEAVPMEITEEEAGETLREESTMDNIPDTPSPGTPPHYSSETLPFNTWSEKQDALLIHKWEMQGKSGCPDSQCPYYKASYHGLNMAETVRDHWRSWHLHKDCKLLWQCPLCNATYVWKQYFMIHMSDKHGYASNVGEFTMMLLRQRWRMEDEDERVTVYREGIEKLECGISPKIRDTIANAVAEMDEEKAHLVPEDMDSMDMDLPSTTWTLHEDEALIISWDRANRKGCINEDCEMYGVSDKLFEPDALRDHWRTSHMKKSGRLQWLCPACPNKKYSQGKTLVRHLTNFHKFTDPLIGRWCKHLLREKWKQKDERRRVLVYDDVQDQELDKTPVTGTAKQLSQLIFGFSINITKMPKQKVARSLEQTKQRLALKNTKEKEQKEQKQKEKKLKLEMKNKEKEEKAKAQEKLESKSSKDREKCDPFKTLQDAENKVSKDSETNEANTSSGDIEMTAAKNASKDPESAKVDNRRDEEEMDTTATEKNTTEENTTEKEATENMQTEEAAPPAEDEEMPFFKIECVISNADQVHATAHQTVIESDSPDEAQTKISQTPPKSVSKPQTPPKSIPKPQTSPKSTTKEPTPVNTKSTPPSSMKAQHKGPSIAPIKKEKKIPTKMPLMPYTTWTEAEDLALVKEWSRQGKNQCIEPNCEHRTMEGLDNIDYFRDHWKNKHMWPKCAFYFCCPFGCFNEDEDTVHSSLDYLMHLKQKHCKGNENVAKYCLWLSRERWFRQDTKHRVNRYKEEETLKVNSYYRKLFTDLIFGAEVKLTKCKAQYQKQKHQHSSGRKHKVDSVDESAQKKKRGRPKKNAGILTDTDDEGVKKDVKRVKREESVESEPPKKKRGRASTSVKLEEKSQGKAKSMRVIEDDNDSGSNSDVEEKKSIKKVKKEPEKKKAKTDAEKSMEVSIKEDSNQKVIKQEKTDEKPEVKEPKSPIESIKSESTSVSGDDVLSGLPYTSWTPKEDSELIARWKEQNIGCIHPKCHLYKVAGFGLDKSTQFRDHWRSEHMSRSLRLAWHCHWCSKHVTWNEDFVRHVMSKHLENNKEAAYYYLHKVRQRWSASSDDSNERVIIYEDADYAKNLQSCVPPKHKEKIDDLVMKNRHRSMTPDQTSRESSKERTPGLPGYTWTLREDEALMAKWDRFGAKGCIDKSCTSFRNNHHMLDEPMPFRDHWRTKHMANKNNIVWTCPWCSKAPYEWADLLHRHVRKQHNKSRGEATYTLCLLRKKWQLEDVNGRIEPNSKGTMARLEKDVPGSIRRPIYDRIIGSKKVAASATKEHVRRISDSPEGTPEPSEPGKLPDGLPNRTWTEAEDSLLIAEWEKRGKGGCIDVNCPCYGKHPRLTRPTSFRDHWRSQHMAPEARISWHCPLKCSSQFEWSEDVLRHIIEVHRYQLRQSAQYCQHLIRKKWQQEDKDNRVLKYEQAGFVKNLLAVVPPFTKSKFEDLVMPKETQETTEKDEKKEEDDKNEDKNDEDQPDGNADDPQGEKKFTIPKVTSVSKLKEQNIKPIHSPVDAAYPEVLKPLLTIPAKKPLFPSPRKPAEDSQLSPGPGKIATPKGAPKTGGGLLPIPVLKSIPPLIPALSRKSWREVQHKEMPGMPYISWNRVEEDNLLLAYHRQTGRKKSTCVHPDCEWYNQGPRNLEHEPKFVEHWKVNHMKPGLELRWECPLCDGVWRWEDDFYKFHLLRAERGGHMLGKYNAQTIVENIKQKWRQRLDDYDPSNPKYLALMYNPEDETDASEVKKKEEKNENDESIDWSTFDPPELPEMPYTSWRPEQEKKLIQTFENQADEKRFTCIHPECPWYTKAPKLLEKTEKFVEHWKVAHMSFGYRLVVQCPYCTERFRWQHELIEHFQKSKQEGSGHDLDIDTAEGMAEGIHWNWENHLARMQRPVQDKAITSTEEAKDGGTPSDKSKPYAESQYWRFTKYSKLAGLPHATWLESEDEALMEEFNKRCTEEGASGTCVHPQCDLYTEAPAVMRNEFVFREHWLVSHMEEKLLFQCSICAKTCRWGHELEEHFRSGLDKLGHSLDAFTALVMKEEIITKWVEKDPEKRKVVRAPLPVSTLSDLKPEEEAKADNDEKEVEEIDEAPPDTAIDDDDNDDDVDDNEGDDNGEDKKEEKDTEEKEDKKPDAAVSQASSDNQPPVPPPDISEQMKQTLVALRQTTSQLLLMQTMGPVAAKKDEDPGPEEIITPTTPRSTSETARKKTPVPEESPAPGTSQDHPHIKKVINLVKQTVKSDSDSLNEKTVAVLLKAIKESMGKKDEEEGMEMVEETREESVRDSFFDSRIPGIMESPTEDPADREYRYSQYGQDTHFPELGMEPEHKVASIWDSAVPRKPGLLDHHPSLDRARGDEDLRHQPKKRGLLDEHPLYGLESGAPQIPGILDNHPVLGFGREEHQPEHAGTKTGLLDDHPQFGNKRQGLLDNHPKFGVREREMEERDIGKKPGLLDAHPKFGLGAVSEPKRGLLDDHPTYGLEEDWPRGPPKRGLLGDPPRDRHADWESTEEASGDYDHVPYTSDTGYRVGTYDRDEWYQRGVRHPPPPRSEYEDRIPPEQIASFKAFEEEWMQGKRRGNVVDDFFNQSYCPKENYDVDEDDHHVAVYPPRPPRRQPPAEYLEDNHYSAASYPGSVWSRDSNREERTYSQEEDYNTPTMPVRPGGFHDRWPSSAHHEEEDTYATDEYYRGAQGGTSHPPPLLKTPRQLRPPERLGSYPPPEMPAIEKPKGKLLVSYDDDFTTDPVEEEEEPWQVNQGSRSSSHPFSTASSTSQSHATVTSQGGLLPLPTSVPSTTVSLSAPVPPPLSTVQRPPLFPIAESTAPNPVAPPPLTAPRPPLFPIMGTTAPQPVPPPTSTPTPTSTPALLPSPTQTSTISSPSIKMVEMEDVSESTKTAPAKSCELEPGEIQDNSDEGDASEHSKSHKHKHKTDKHQDKHKWRTGGFSQTKVSERDAIHSSELKGEKAQKQSAESSASKEDEEDLTQEEKVDMKNILREVCDQVLDVITGKETAKTSLRHDVSRLNLGQVALVQRVEKLASLRKKDDALYIINKLCTKPPKILDRLEKLDLQRKLGKVPEMTAMYKVVQILGLLKILRKAFGNFFSK